MATVFTHPAVAIALLPWFRRLQNRWQILMIGALLTILPDFDVIGLRLGIPYGDMLGHRGLTHSIFFAVLVSVVFARWSADRFQLRFLPVWLYYFLCLISHGVLDALTDGGLGIAFFAPFDNHRYFFPLRPIMVSPLNIARFFQGQGAPVLINELKWVWFPCLVIFLVGFAVYRRTTRNHC